MYIGCHKTTNPNDEYIGSGKLLKRAIKKYGIDNFQKEVLFIFDTAEEMFSKEKEIVDKLFVEAENNYNLLVGGFGGYDYLNSTGKNLYGKNGKQGYGGENLLTGKKFEKYKEYLIEKGLWEDWKKKISNSLKKTFSEKPFHWLGRKHTKETKRKIGEKLSMAQNGEKNSQYGTCWIYSDDQKKNCRIKKDDLSSFIKIGWKLGRKMNFMGGV